MVFFFESTIVVKFPRLESPPDCVRILPFKKDSHFALPIALITSACLFLAARSPPRRPWTPMQSSGSARPGALPFRPASSVPSVPGRWGPPGLTHASTHSIPVQETARGNGQNVASQRGYYLLSLCPFVPHTYCRNPCPSFCRKERLESLGPPVVPKGKMAPYYFCTPQACPVGPANWSSSNQSWPMARLVGANSP